MSSAYIRQFTGQSFSNTALPEDCKYLGRSLMKILKRLGFRLSPCLSPILKRKLSEISLLTFIHDLLTEYMFLIIL
jgi:hypothetical protein